jgi:hypothetical protein
VYRARGLHFVSDGHHRVSVAAATGQQVIEAYVTEIPATPAAGTAKAAGPGRPRQQHCAEGESDGYS